MLVPLQIPPGVFRNGTDLQSSGRWRDASLVRWHEGTMRPVGGWAARTDSQMDAAPRGAISWVDNSGDRRVVFGTFDALYHLSEGNTLSEISPAALTAGVEDSTLSLGYGGSFYGTAYYGTSRPATTYTPVTTWSLDTWGQYLIACSYADGVIWKWELDTGTEPAAVTNAPTGNIAAMVTEERFLVALGAGGDPRKVQWSDRESETTWTPAATNEAGDQLLQTGGAIMQGLRARGEAVILTDSDAHTMTYIGPPFVYGFRRVGSSCGALSRLGAVAANGVVYWMSPNGFFRYAGGGAEELPCDVSDYVFSNLNSSQASKVWAVTNTKYNEVWWFYPQGAECDSYVCYNYAENHWSTGSLPRTAGVDAGVFDRPIFADPDGFIYDHEKGFNYDDSDVYAESGPITFGDTIVWVTDLLPDEATQGDVTVTFKTRFYPNDTEYTHGPYSMAAPTSVRFSGRQIRARVTGNNPASWRWGIPRIDTKPAGRR